MFVDICKYAFNFFPNGRIVMKTGNYCKINIFRVINYDNNKFSRERNLSNETEVKVGMAQMLLFTNNRNHVAYF